MASRNLEAARVLLTGASRGIGAALARQLSQAGCQLLLTARNPSRLEAVAAECRGPTPTILAGDLTDPDHRDLLLETVRRNWSALDVLVNNAGVGAVGPFATASSDRLRQLMELNFFAPLELTRSCLAPLRSGRDPLIVNVGSVLGHRAVPEKSEYCASKFALHGFSDALRAELREIEVLLVSPSTTRSEFFENLLEGTDTAGRQGVSPEYVARRTLRAMRRRKHEVIPSVAGKWLVWFDRLFPTLANHAVARWTPQRPDPPSQDPPDPDNDAKS